MKRKLGIIFALPVLLIILSACGTTDSSNAAEDVEEISTEEVSQEGDMTNDQSTDDTETTNVPENDIEDTELKDNTPAWYMDSEGVKNNEFGVMVSKDDARLDSVSLAVNFGIYTPHSTDDGGSYSQQVFSCNYYDGDLDNYISEKNAYYDQLTPDVAELYYGSDYDKVIEERKWRKENLNGIDFAYSVDRDNNQAQMVFIGNGIIVSSNDFELNEDMKDYLDRINLIKPYSGSFTDYIAYQANDGLYCPALGIEFTCDMSENGIFGMGLNYYFEDYSASIHMSDEKFTEFGTTAYFVDAESAQEVVDNYVKISIEPSEDKTTEATALEGTQEINIGKYKFLGRGVLEKYEWDDSGTQTEAWFFYSDDTTWSVSIDYYEGGTYMDCLSIFKEIA